MNAQAEKAMKRVGALIESVPRRDPLPARGRATEPLPWPLAFISAGALAMAGLLVLALELVTMPAVPPRMETHRDEARSVGMPPADQVEGGAPVLRVGPVYTR